MTAKHIVLAALAAHLLPLFGSRSPLAAADPEAPWKEILGRQVDVPLPRPRPQVEWLTDYGSALRQAQDENRPLFVTFRCLPCKQCAEFDKDVLEGGAELEPLLAQFVTMRATNAEHIDLRLFDVAGYQDLDLSWWGYFLSPQGQVYGIFGGKDHVSDATRISVEALANTMQRVLEHHYDPRRKQWDIDGPAPDLSKPPIPTYKLPGFQSYARRYLPKEQGCLHCHQVGEALRQPAIDAGTFDKLRDTQVWPLPENVGLTLDRDHGLLVSKVEADSPAGRAGIRAGDVLGAAGGRRLFGQADFRGVLHRGPKGAGQIKVRWLSEGEVRSGVLEVEDGWRRTVLDWRMSISQGNIGSHPGFFPNKPSQNQRRQLGVRDDAMAVKPFMTEFHQSLPAYQAGLRNSDIITAVNGRSPNVVGRSFLVWFRLQFDPGDEVTLSATGPDGKQRSISYTLR